MRQAGDEINIEIGDAGGAQANNFFEDDGAGVQAADGAGFGVDKGLHPEADTVHAAAQQQVDNLGRKRAGSAFDSDFGIGSDFEIFAQAIEDARELLGREHGGSAATEINRINLALEPRAHRGCELGGARDVAV